MISKAKALEAENEFCEQEATEEEQEHNTQHDDGECVVPVFKSFANDLGECKYDNRHAHHITNFKHPHIRILLS